MFLSVALSIFVVALGYAGLRVHYHWEYAKAVRSLGAIHGAVSGDDWVESFARKGFRLYRWQAEGDTPTSPEDTPTSPEDTPTSPEDTPTSPEDTPASPEDTPASPEDTPNPLDTPTPEREPEWVGGFVNEQAQMTLAAYLSGTDPNSLEGVLVSGVSMQTFDVKANISDDRLVGTFGKAGQERFPFTATLESSDTLVFVSGNSTYRLTRHPEAPRTSAELRAGVQKAVVQANESAAVGSLKATSSAQELFREGDKDGNGELDYAASLEALARVDGGSLIDPVLASGVKNGYRFEVRRSRKEPNYLWMATATPVEPGQTGHRHFVTNHRGVVYSGNAPFELNDECEIPRGATPVGQGGTPPSPPSSSPPAGPDLSHVKVGQRYVYALQGGSMEMVWEVTEVDAANFVVRYSTQTHMDLGRGKQPVGDPIPAEWRHVVADTTEAPAATTSPRDKTSKGTHRVSGTQFECLIVESYSGGMSSKTWVPLSKGTDVPTFPGMLKSEANGAVSMELVRIDRR